MGIEHASDNSRSDETITPIQRSRQPSPLEHSRNFSSHLNTKSLGGILDLESQTPNISGAPERRHSSDPIIISGVKRVADLNSKFFLHIK